MHKIVSVQIESDCYFVNRRCHGGLQTTCHALLFWKNYEQVRAVEKWLASHPDNVARALEWTSMLAPEMDQEVFGELMMSKSQVWANAQPSHPDASTDNKKRLNFYNHQWPLQRYLAIAAGLALVCSLAWLRLKESEAVRIVAAYGQTRHVMLPDSSEVVLNGNSSLRYAASWEGRQREVWLEGEAFFDVKHLRTHAGFTQYEFFKNPFHYRCLVCVRLNYFFPSNDRVLRYPIGAVATQRYPQLDKCRTGFLLILNWSKS